LTLPFFEHPAPLQERGQIFASPKAHYRGFTFPPQKLCSGLPDNAANWQAKVAKTLGFKMLSIYGTRHCDKTRLYGAKYA